MINSKVIFVTSLGKGIKQFKITYPIELERQTLTFEATNIPYVVNEGQDYDTITFRNATFNFELTSKFVPGNIIINGTNTNVSNINNYEITGDTDITCTNYSIDKNNFPLNYYARDCIDNYTTISELSEFTEDELTDIIPLPDASYAFSDCSDLESLNDVQLTWDMSNVTNMSYMFNNCSSMEDFDLSGWDFSNVTSTNGFFNGCTSIKSVKIDGTISGSNLSNMFNSLKSNTNVSISLDLSEATCEIGNAQWSSYASIRELELGPNITFTSSENDSTSPRGFFDGCYNLERLDVTNMNLDNIVYPRCMFRNLRSLTSLDLSNWDTTKVQNFCYSDYDGVFSGLNGVSNGLHILDISKFSTINTRTHNKTRSLFYLNNYLEYLIIGNSEFRFRMDFNTNCGQLNNTCKILVPTSLMKNFVNDSGWFRKVTQLKPIENYTITRNKGQVSVTPKQLTVLDLSNYTIGFVIFNKAKSTIYARITDTNDQLLSTPYFFINLTDVTNSTTTNNLLAELLDELYLSWYNYKIELSSELDLSNNSYTISIPIQEIKDYSIETATTYELIQGLDLSTPSGLNIFGIEYNKTTHTWQRIDTNCDPDTTTTESDINNSNLYSSIEDIVIDTCNMVKIPKFYFLFQDQANTYRWWISDSSFTINELGTAKIHPAFVHNNSIINQFYVGKYEASADPNDSTKLHSRAGVTPLTNKLFSEFKTMAEARNTDGITGFQLMDFYQLAAIQLLILIQIANGDVETSIGTGINSGSARVATDNANSAIWHGIYNLWGNTWANIDYFQVRYGTYYIYDKNDSEEYLCTNILTPSSNDYSTKISPEWAEKGFIIPTNSTSTAADAIFPDRIASNYSISTAVLLHGGRYGNGTKNGIFNYDISEEITTWKSADTSSARIAKY